MDVFGKVNSAYKLVSTNFNRQKIDTLAFITKSNSLKIISRVDFQKTGNLERMVYKMPIYFFSPRENNILLGLRELFKNPDKFIAEYYKPIETVDSFRYVYEGKPPSYHCKSDCSRLNSNYRNFEIPVEISDKGPELVNTFRRWFKENAYLLDKPDTFVFRLQSAFGVQMNPASINFDNSGVEEIENLELPDLELKIDELIRKAGRYFNESPPDKKELLNRFQKYTWLAYSHKEITNNTTGLSDTELKDFLREYDKEYKKPVKNILIEYYRILYNPDMKFEGTLLEQLGFKPCAECHEHYKVIEQIDIK